jgi:hypothetical protein
MISARRGYYIEETPHGVSKGVIMSYTMKIFLPYRNILLAILQGIASTIYTPLESGEKEKRK